VKSRPLLSRGVTLIELMVALAISSILIAALYRTFISQQKTHTTQEQVVDIQQSARASINRMMKELRGAGFGNVGMVLPVSFSASGRLRKFDHIVNPDTPVSGALTIVTANRVAAKLLKGAGDEVGGRKLLLNQFVVSRLNDDEGDPLFDTKNRKYISIGGVESHTISEVDPGDRVITLEKRIVHRHPAGTPVFSIRALSYQIAKDKETLALKRDENMGGGRQPLAENIEELQFEYFDQDGEPTLVPEDICMIRVAVTARGGRPDPDLREGDGFRRRRIASYVHLRNLGLP